MTKLSHKLLTVALIFCMVMLASDAQFGKQITVTAGTPIRLVNTRTMVSSLLIQMKHGGSGLGLVYNADPAIACSAGTLVAELAPATATSPGGSYTFPSNGSATTESSGFDINYVCVDGSNSGDVLVTSWNVR